MTPLTPLQKTFLVAAFFLYAAHGLAQPVDHAAIESVMREALQSWTVPGAAVAIVHQDRVVYLKGFGVKKAGAKDRVTPDTIFPLASCSKSFTVLALAMLADEGKVAWDDPVRKHVPFFRLADPLADGQVTLRDLLCHRTGLAGHDMLWYRSPWKLDERVRKLAQLQPRHLFRGQFEYQAICFGAAGLAVGAAAKSTWQDFVHQRIFAPLGMKSACCTSAQALRATDHAQPHRQTKDGKIEAIPWYKISEPDPAGSIHASVRDLSQFVRLQLGDGTWQGRRLVSAANLAEPHTPQMVIRREGFAKAMNPDTLQLSYGLGWVIQDYRGQLLILHGGAIDGFRAHITLVPRARLGIVLCNNLDRTQMNMAVSNSLVDLFLRLPAKDWNAFFRAVMAADEAEQKERAKALRESRPKDPKPARAYSAYAGIFEDTAYGIARITVEKNTLVLHWNTFQCPLEHWDADTFLANNDVFVDAPVRFTFHNGAALSLRALDREFKRKR